MVWSKFPIKIFGVHFGNSVLDNSNWDKISHSLTKRITHMWGRWDTPQNFLLAFIDELWKTWKIRILKKWKKIAGDIIILHMCTKNHNHMRYSSWDTKWDRIFCHFEPLFVLLTPAPFTSSSPFKPSNNPGNQNFE